MSTFFIANPLIILMPFTFLIFAILFLGYSIHRGNIITKPIYNNSKYAGPIWETRTDYTIYSIISDKKLEEILDAITTTLDHCAGADVTLSYEAVGEIETLLEEYQYIRKIGKNNNG